MEKIRLNNGVEFDLIPMGITVYDKYITLSLISDMSYTELESLFMDADIISKIQYISTSGEIFNTYTTAVSLKKLSKTIGGYIERGSIEDGSGDIYHDVYTIELDTDATITALRNLQKKVTLLEQEKNTLKDLVDALVVSSLEVQ